MFSYLSDSFLLREIDLSMLIGRVALNVMSQIISLVWLSVFINVSARLTFPGLQTTLVTWCVSKWWNWWRMRLTSALIYFSVVLRYLYKEPYKPFGSTTRTRYNFKPRSWGIDWNKSYCHQSRNLPQVSQIFFDFTDFLHFSEGHLNKWNIETPFSFQKRTSAIHPSKLLSLIHPALEKTKTRSSNVTS